jgi:hypothetical protein
MLLQPGKHTSLLLSIYCDFARAPRQGITSSRASTLLQQLFLCFAGLSELYKHAETIEYGASFLMKMSWSTAWCQRWKSCACQVLLTTAHMGVHLRCNSWQPPAGDLASLISWCTTSIENVLCLTSNSVHGIQPVSTQSWPIRYCSPAGTTVQRLQSFGHWLLTAAAVPPARTSTRVKQPLVGNSCS